MIKNCISFKLFLCLILAQIFSNVYSQSAINPIPHTKQIYRNYYEFITQKHDSTALFHIDSTLRKGAGWNNEHAYFPVDSNNRIIKNIWGFSDGKSNFVSFGDDFFKIFERNNDLYFYGYDLPDYSGMELAYYIGGIPGMMIHTMIRDSKAKRSSTSFYIDKETGLIFSSKVKMLEFDEKNRTNVVIYRLHKKESDKPIEFKIADTIYTLAPNSYINLSIKYTYKPLIIENIQAKDSIEIFLDVNKTKYIKCSSKAKDISNIKIEEVPFSTGDFEIYKPMQKEKKKKKG